MLKGGTVPRFWACAPKAICMRKPRWTLTYGGVAAASTNTLTLPFRLGDAGVCCVGRQDNNIQTLQTTKKAEI